MTKKQLGKGGVYFICHPGSQSRNSKQELIQKLWSVAAYWLVLQPVSLCHPGPPTQEWHHLHQSSIKKMYLRLAHSPVWWRHLLS